MTDTIERVEEAHGLEVRPPRDRPSTIVQIAQLLAFVALVASFVGALGPAHKVRTTYAWPPRTMPRTTPARMWYTPLLLASQRPESLATTLPCSLPRALPGTAKPAVVLATARHPQSTGALAITRRGRSLSISLGARELDRVDLPAASNGSCAYTLLLEHDRWTLTGTSGQVAGTGDLSATPFVDGLFSSLDLRAAGAPSVEVVTNVHAVQILVRQKVAWAVAALAALSALALVGSERRRRRRSRLREAVRRAARSAHPADAVVGLALLLWWVISPSFWDDGWVEARQSMFASSHGFSNYYDSLGGNLPVGFWLEWTQHWLIEATSVLLWLRVPALMCLAATWILCRWILARVVASPRGVVLWTLASAFLVCAMAWGMTLRPEPVTALLATGVLACMVSFRERERARAVALATLLALLAVTGHHAGVVAFAPMVATLPRLLAWARARPAVTGAIMASGIAVVVTLAFVGSDVAQRRADAQWTLTYGTARVTWHDELVRYTLLGSPGYGTPLRRASVALIGLAVLSFLLWRRRNGSRLDLPGATLGVTLLLLLLTPTRHPFHFGALTGFTAIAVAAETARLREDALGARRWSARPFLVLVAATLAAAWSWSPRFDWAPLDLRTLDWTPAFEAHVSVSGLATFAPVVLLLVAGVLAVRDRHRDPSGQTVWRAAAWLAPIVAAPIVVFTAAVLVADTAKTDGWTLARQNLDAFAGSVGCGLADDGFVVDRRSVTPIRAGATSPPLPGWVPPRPARALPAYALTPAGGNAAFSPWFALRQDRPAALLVAGQPGADDQLLIEWGRRGPHSLESLRTDLVSTALSPDMLSDVGAWHLLTAGELPSRPPAADAMRAELVLAPGSEAAVAVTAPIAYRSTPLLAELRPATSSTLVMPPAVTYLPCVRQPRLANGVVEVPGQIVTLRAAADTPVAFKTSPWLGLLDLYPIERLPWADTPDAPRDLTVFKVDRRLQGAAVVPPARLP